MATITPGRSRNLHEENRRVRHPLERLRGYIRSYISLEGLAVVALYLALWFWIAYVMDYGFFKATGVDWVQLLAPVWWIRVAVLVLILAGLLAALVVKVVLRLFREFSDASLALLLEKRFPELLGDRLITAVELSDADKAAQYGYSRAMVVETIHEAADRVDQLPLGQVFDWKRLVRRGVLIGFLVLVGYLLAVSVYGAVAALREGHRVTAGLTRFNDVAGILVERNVLLQNTIWPRNAHLEVVSPAVTELRIGRDAPAPNIRVRALRFVVADRKSPDGWRALTWQDLTDRPELLHGEVAAATPDFWRARDEDVGLTADEVELRLNQLGVRKYSAAAGEATWFLASADSSSERPLLWSDLTSKKLAGLPVPQTDASLPRLAAGFGLVGSPMGQGSLLAGSYLAMVGLSALTVDDVDKMRQQQGFETPEIKAVFNYLDRLADLQKTMERLEEQANNPSMSRTLRKLAVPPAVILVYAGETTTYRKTLTKSPDDEVTGNEYTGIFTDLKAEQYKYWAAGDDYTTANRYLTVLPPPTLDTLYAEQNRPAYLYYRPTPGSDGRELRGLKQPFEKADVSARGSDVARIDVPSGTDVTLIGQANKELSKVVIKPFKDGDVVRGKVGEIKAENFKAAFLDVRTEQNFVFILTDIDGVVGTRHVIIRPREDQAPDLVDVMPDAVVRKTKDGYMVALEARIPFSGSVVDDNGLSGVRYAYTLAKIDSSARVNVGALIMYATIPGLVAGRASPLLAAGLYVTAQQEGARPVEPDLANQQVIRLPSVPAFQKALNEQPADAKGRPEQLPLREVKTLLADKQPLYEKREGKLVPYRELLRKLELKPDNWSNAETDPLKCDFALAPLKLRTSLREVQPRFKMQLWVEAVDTDVDSEAEKDGTPRPHVSPSKDKFTFLIVSETELLTEIGREEEELRVKLEEVADVLKESEAKLVRDTIDLRSAAIKAPELGPMGGRMEMIGQLLEKQQQKTKEVSTDYFRILKELRFNRIDSKLIDRVDKTIVSPLADIEKWEFSKTLDSISNFRKALDEARATNNAADFPASLAAARTAGDQAREQVRALKEALSKVLDSMATVTNINKLIKMLRDIEEQEQSQADLIKKIKEEIERSILEGALQPLPPKKKP